MSPQRFRMWLRRRQNVAAGYIAVVYCGRHDLDLAAVTRFFEDGRPRSTSDAAAAIESGECPACRYRYLAGPAPTTRRDGDGWLRCGCCDTAWATESDGFVALVDGGLTVVEGTEPIPPGASIDSSSFRIEPVDPVAGPEKVMRTALAARSAQASAGMRLSPETLAELAGALGLAYRGRARIEAEVYWILDGSGLDTTVADGWRDITSDILEDVRRLFGGKSSPRLPARRPRVGGAIELPRARFEQLVAEALDGLPPQFGEVLENVAVVVESRSDRDTDRAVVLGLYEGVPITTRGANLGDPRRPDRITIFQDTICAFCSTEEQVVERVRRTVIHEVGHHFAIDDDRLHELGW